MLEKAVKFVAVPPIGAEIDLADDGVAAPLSVDAVTMRPRVCY